MIGDAATWTFTITTMGLRKTVRSVRDVISWLKSGIDELRLNDSFASSLVVATAPEVEGTLLVGVHSSSCCVPFAGDPE